MAPVSEPIAAGGVSQQPVFVPNERLFLFASKGGNQRPSELINMHLNSAARSSCGDRDIEPRSFLSLPVHI